MSENAVDRFGFFDSLCTVGRHLKLQAGGLHTAEQLLEDMDRCGVAEALVLDSLSRENHPVEGNPRILDVCAAHPRLNPAWAAIPHAPSDEQPRGEALVESMRQSDVRALFVFARQYRVPLADWAVDDFFAPLAAARVPVFLNYNEVGPVAQGWDQTDWPELVNFCRRHPQLPVIWTEWRIRRQNRALYRALDACPNLHIEISGCWLHHHIEYVTRTFGAHRLIFGSNWPRYGQEATLTTLTCADIDDGNKRRIAGDNLRELLSWNEPVAAADVELPAPADEYAAFARSGRRPARMTFLDNHGHMGGYSFHYHLPNASADDCVADMDRLGVQKTCIFSFSGASCDEHYGNDLVIDAVQRYPDRFIGFTLLNPHRGEKWMLEELRRCAEGGLRGVKLIAHYQGYPEEGPMIDVPCQWAHEHGQIILNHNWGLPAQVERLVTTYPDACFFTGHTTTAYADIMKRHANLYVCSCPLISPRACRHLVSVIGADRLLFGSDMSDLPITWGLGPILLADLPVEDKRKILGGNLEQILARYSRKSDPS